MKVFFTLLSILLCANAVSAQVYPVGKRTIAFTDLSRNNRVISTDVYYPAALAGNNTALAAGTASFPVVVFGHGFLIGTGSYLWLADSLASHGYVVALPTTEGGILPSHAQFGNDLSFLCSRITSLTDSASSFLYQRVIKKAAVGGHSMGGGASFLAAAQNNVAISTLFNFAAAETNPSATTAALAINKPSLIFSGSSDCIAAPAVQQAMYNNLPGCKIYINITSALHCQYANNNAVCATGQVLTGCNSSAISAATVYNKTIALLLPFLDYQLKNICTRGNDFDNAYNTLTGITKQRSCLPFPTCGVLPVTIVNFTGVINNGKAKLTWKTATEININNYSVERSQEGLTFAPLVNVLPKASSGGAADYTAADLYPFSGAAFYRLRINENNGSYSYSNVVKLAVPVKSLTITALYPNPVKDFLTVQIQSDQNQEVTLTVVDMSGREIFQQKELLAKGVFYRSVNCNFLTAGTYMLRYKTKANAEGAGNFKIVKIN